MKTFLDNILTNLSLFEERNAFCINETFYSFKEFKQKVAGITAQLKSKNLPKQTPIGVVTTDTLESYASIISLWLNGMIFVPISPENAKDRNVSCIKQAKVNYILSPTLSEAEIVDSRQIEVIETASLTADKELENLNTDPDNNLYILFTSGSTGTPKGVPITLKNLDSFVSAFYSIGYPINEEDRFLQIFDFTFDVSVQSYVLPLVKGACIYTVPQTEIKFMGALKILKNHKITFAKLVPSTLNYFKPYFNRIDLPFLKYSLFSGEALPYQLAQEWSKCVPNASIENHYGPTEATIDCTSYIMNSSEEESHQGTMSIGKAFKGIDAQIIDENNNFINSNDQGELIISGNQVTKGYLDNPTKNKEALIKLNNQTYYRTGDIVYRNNEGNIFYCGRMDNQLQIQGYRVELGEVEFHIKKLIPNKNIAVASYTESDALFLTLFIEGEQDFDLDLFKNNLKENLPHYMLPKKINFITEFPLTTSGKTNIKQLKELV